MRSAKRFLRYERTQHALNTVEFLSGAFEPHTITIDLRKDIDEQLKGFADYCPDECDIETLQRDFEKAMKKREAERVEEETGTARIERIKDSARHTGTKKIIERFNAPCNDPHEDCSHDIVTVWAMPDGSVQETRIHTY